MQTIKKREDKLYASITSNSTLTQELCTWADRVTKGCSNSGNFIILPILILIKGVLLSNTKLTKNIPQ